MSSTFYGRGNIGSAPELRFVPVNGEQKAVCDLSIFFDRRVPDGKGGYVDKGGFWRDVSYWGARGERAHKLLKPGARVFVVGTELQERWPNKEGGDDHTKIALIADTIDLDLLSVEAITYREKRVEPQEEAAPIE